MANAFARSLLAVAFSVVCAQSGAQDYPTRPIRMIVPFAPGGGSDISGRILADGLSQKLGQTIIVDNRPGAGSTIGADIAAKASADGYTLFLGNISLAFNASLYRNLPFDAIRDFATVSLVVDQPNIMVANPSLPARSLKEFVALARATPGKLTYASAGTGSGTHLAMEMLLMNLDMALIHVPYKGTGPALTALLSNEISVFLSTFASALPHVKAGRLRTFGVSSAKRAASLPEAPTIAESGVPGFEYSTWYGLLVPAATPRAIVEKLNTATVGLLKGELEPRYRAVGMEAIPTTPADFSAKLRSETQKWTQVIRAAKIAQQ